MNKAQMNNPINFPCKCGFKDGKWNPYGIYYIKDLRGDGCMHKITCRICGKWNQLCGD